MSTFNPDDLEQTYIFDGQEVKLTGRKAVKILPSKKVDTLYEIKPCAVYEQKLRWVREGELFVVVV